MASPVVVPPELLQKSAEELRSMLASAREAKTQVHQMASSAYCRRGMRGARRRAHRHMVRIRTALALVRQGEGQRERKREDRDDRTPNQQSEVRSPRQSRGKSRHGGRPGRRPKSNFASAQTQIPARMRREWFCRSCGAENQQHRATCWSCTRLR